MAKIIPFRRRPKKLKATNQASSSLSEALRELLEAGVNWEELSRNSSVAEIYELEDRIHLRVLLPKQRKENLRVGLSTNMIRIRILGGAEERTLHHIPLPYQVEEASAIASYQDDYLDVELMKLTEGVQDETSIPIF